MFLLLFFKKEWKSYLHWEKNIVNFNKYLVQYCQLNIIYLL